MDGSGDGASKVPQKLPELVFLLPTVAGAEGGGGGDDADRSRIAAEGERHAAEQQSESVAWAPT